MSSSRALREEVCQANRDLVRHELVTLTWGNVSGLSPDRELVAIKPSGVAYADLRPETIVLVELSSGRVVESRLRPSTDTPTHLGLYRAFAAIGGITHTHSAYATMFAQARREIPCLGTTHADHFRGAVPVTRQLTPEEVAGDYEAATARVIVERFRDLDPLAMPGVLLAGHAPFCWGTSAAQSLENALALEAIALVAYGTMIVAAPAPPMELEPHLLAKHHQRKHGPSAYYGQPPA